MAANQNEAIDVENMDESYELQVLWNVPAEAADTTCDYNVGRRDLIDLATPDLIDLATPEPGQNPAPGTPGIPDTPPNSPLLNGTHMFEVEYTPRTSTPIGTPPGFGSDFPHIPQEAAEPSQLSSSHHSTAGLQEVSMSSSDNSGELGSVYDYPPADDTDHQFPEEDGSYYTIAAREAFFGAPSLDFALLSGPDSLHGDPKWQPDGVEFLPDMRSASWLTILALGNGRARFHADDAQAKAIAFAMLGLQRQLRLSRPHGQLVIEPALVCVLPRDKPLVFQGPEVAPRGTVACPNCLLWYQFDAHGGPTTAIWISAHRRRDPTFRPPHVSSKERFGLFCLNPACRSPNVCLTEFHPILDDGYYGSEFLSDEFHDAFKAQFDFEELFRILEQKPVVPPLQWTPELPLEPTPTNALVTLWERVTETLQPELPLQNHYGTSLRFALVPHELRWAPTASGRPVLSDAAMAALPLCLHVDLIADHPVCEYGCPNCLWTWGVAQNNQRTHIYAWYPVCPLPECFRPELYSDLAVFVSHQCPNPACTRPNHPVLLTGPGEESSLRLPPTCRQYQKAAYFDVCNNPGRLINSWNARIHTHPHSLAH